MRVKSTAMVFTKQTAIGPGLWLSNEILCILAAQRAAEIQEVKVEGPKKNPYVFQASFYSKKPIACHTLGNVFVPSSLTPCCFSAPWDAKMYDILFESPKPGPIPDCLVKIVSVF